MNQDFSCCSPDGVQKGVKVKVCPECRYHKMACSMVYTKSLLNYVYKHGSLFWKGNDSRQKNAHKRAMRENDPGQGDHVILRRRSDSLY